MKKKKKKERKTIVGIAQRARCCSMHCATALRPNTRETTGLSREQVSLKPVRENWMKKKSQWHGIVRYSVEDVKVDGPYRGTEKERNEKRKRIRQGSPVACSCLIEQSSLMREIDEIHTCGTNTQVQPSLLTVGELGDTLPSMGASSGTSQRVDSMFNQEIFPRTFDNT